MGLTILVTTITVVASVLVAAVIVLVVTFLALRLVDLIGAHRPRSPEQQLEDDYRAARHAMADAVNQSWRNLID